MILFLLGTQLTHVMIQDEHKVVKLSQQPPSILNDVRLTGRQQLLWTGKSPLTTNCCRLVNIAMGLNGKSSTRAG
jgi:hypothetical protein